MSPTSASTLTARLARWIPAVGWLASYRLSWLRVDLVAGITLAAYLLPGGIGDASLANLPPEAGIYACLFSALVFWLFCSSRHTAISVTSAISLLIGSSLGGIANGDASRFSALAAGTAILVSLIAFLAWLVKAGSIVNFISESVLVGFKCGVALFLASTQLPKLFGVHGAHGDFWENSGTFLKHLNETNPASLAIGGSALAALVLGKIFLKNRPVAIFVVVGGIVASGLLGLDARGVKLLGEVPQGLPAIGLPAIQWADLNALLPLAVACFMLGAVETAAIGRTFAAKHGGRLDANQEFLALAASNLAAGLGRGFPSAAACLNHWSTKVAGPARPVGRLCGVNPSGSDAIPHTFIECTAATGIGSCRARGSCRFVPAVGPETPLAIQPKAEFAVAMPPCWRAGAGLLRGVLIGALLSLVLLIRRVSRPHVAFLGRIPDTSRFSDLERHPDNEAIPEVLIFRAEAGLLYFNINHVRDTIEERVRAEKETKLVVLDLSEVSIVDMHAAEMLAGLAGELAAKGIKIQAVEAHSQVRDRLRSEGLEERLGGIERLRTVADVADDFLRGPAESR